MTTAKVTTRPQGFTDHVSTPNSKVISEAWFDAETQRLFMTLKNGTRVGYRDFSDYTWKTFLANDSVGRFWNRYIKDKYTGLNGDVDLFDRRSEKPSVEAKPAPGVYSGSQGQPKIVASNPQDTVAKAGSVFTAYEAQRTAAAKVTKVYRVLVEVTAETLNEALASVENGTIVGITQKGV